MYLNEDILFEYLRYIIGNNDIKEIVGNCTGWHVSTKNKTNALSLLNQSKPKMSNFFELLTDPIENIQKKYEILFDIISEYNGKVNGSQRDRNPKTGLIDILVYYEVPLGQRDEVKKKFNNYTRNIISLQPHQRNG